jgi:hypothetical protein
MAAGGAIAAVDLGGVSRLDHGTAPEGAVLFHGLPPAKRCAKALQEAVRRSQERQQ